MPLLNNNIIPISYFSDQDVLKELVKFLNKLLAKDFGERAVTLDTVKDLSRDEVYALRLTPSLAKTEKKFDRHTVEEYIKDFFELKHNYVDSQLRSLNQSKKGVNNDDFVMEVTQQAVAQNPQNVLNQNMGQNDLVPSAQPVATKAVVQKVRRGQAPIIKQQSATSLSEQINYLSFLSRQLHQVRVQNQQMQFENMSPMRPRGNRRQRANQEQQQEQQREKEQLSQRQVSHRLIPRPTLNVFNSVMREQEKLASKKLQEQQQIANKKKSELEKLALKSQPRPTPFSKS